MSLLQDYAVPPDRYDEMLVAPGQPRDHWRAFVDALAVRASADVSETLASMGRAIRDHGITYNVYADPKGADRPWQVDPLPLLVSPDEWAQIEAGIAQRAELLNRVLADLYGPQTLLASGAVPPAVVFGHSGYLHQVHGVRPPGNVHLFHYAADLARSPDGRWWVVNDRTQAPSGAGYALENRLVVARVFPQQFGELGVRHLAAYFAILRDALRHWAPRGDGPPLVALLTPGPYNETYFEHALLARYLGFTLAEGSDLTVRDGKLWLKTVAGLERVHALLRRQDDDYCDPLELRADSALGIPGLTDCVRRGSVMLANALGSGVLESGALLGYLPRLAEQMLGESLRLPSVATWWLGEPAALADAFERLDNLMIKPLDRASGEEGVFVADLAPADRAALEARLAARPQRYVAQEWVRVSQAPVLGSGPGGPEDGIGERLRARTVGLRVFALATPDGYRVMPGGLTRVAGEGDTRVIAMQRGGWSKDTWVLSEGRQSESFSLLSRTIGASELRTAHPKVSSRAAENLFWFGRYSERCEAAARMLRAASSAALGGDAVGGNGLGPLHALGVRQGLLDPGADVVAAVQKAATDPASGLGAELQRLTRVAFTLRERMSLDHWRTLNSLHSDPIYHYPAGLHSMPLALAWLDRAVSAMTTLSGFVLDGMTRSTDWRFMSLGRRLERLLQQCAALEVAIGAGRSAELGWLLELNDSSMTYRTRYPVAPEWLPVLDLLIHDVENPRSMAFQLKGVTEFVAKLEFVHGAFASDLLQRGAETLHALAIADLNPEGARLAAMLSELEGIARDSCDALTLKFFSHAAPHSVLARVA